MSEYTTWDEKTISFIQQQRDVLKDVSSRIGISAEALAGTMAKENNGYQTGTACEQAKDLWATGGGLYDHDWWAAEYALIKDLDLTDSASGTTGQIAKVFFPGLIDLRMFWGHHT